MSKTTDGSYFTACATRVKNIQMCFAFFFRARAEAGKQAGSQGEGGAGPIFSVAPSGKNSDRISRPVRFNLRHQTTGVRHGQTEFHRATDARSRREPSLFRKRFWHEIDRLRADIRVHNDGGDDVDHVETPFFAIVRKCRKVLANWREYAKVLVNCGVLSYFAKGPKRFSKPLVTGSSPVGGEGRFHQHPGAQTPPGPMDGAGRADDLAGVA